SWTGRRYGPQIEAERFVLRDAHGVRRAELGLRENEPLLVLLDEKESPRVTLNSRPPGLALSDERDVVRAYLYHLAYGPGLDLRDGDGRIRAWLGQRKEGPALQLLDENDKPVFTRP